MDKQAIERLTAKSPKAAIIQRIAEDFRLAPIMARAMFKQIDQYYRQYFPELPEPGQMTFLAVSADVPPGRAVASSQRIPAQLTMDTPERVLDFCRRGSEAQRNRFPILHTEPWDHGGSASPLAAPAMRSNSSHRAPIQLHPRLIDILRWTTVTKTMILGRP